MNEQTDKPTGFITITVPYTEREGTRHDSAGWSCDLDGHHWITVTRDRREVRARFGGGRIRPSLQPGWFCGERGGAR